MKKETWNDSLYFKGHLDCLFFYSKHIKEIAPFIKNKEIAAKIHVENGVFLRRGSKDLPLFIKEFSDKELNNKFFELRTKMKRAEAIENKLLTKVQEKLWLYFPPNKPVEFFYATNGEGQGKQIERIFIDLDRTNLPTEKAKIVAKALVKDIKEDKGFNKLLKYKIQVLFTGSSYHVYLLLEKPINHNFYEKYLSYSKNEKIPSFIGKWAKSISKNTGISVTGGHEKTKDIIILDPSGTPSGKLARVPFSIHIKNDKIDSIARFISLEH
ncbi:MAG: hypothetical protein NTX24_02935 [Candidatus Pacearchaeota archaeon]|nr:hypothetical protein [Candidatus Pacearchaeota archaeon]